MKKAEIIELFKQSTELKPLIRLHLKYDVSYSYWFPFKASEKLFLAAREEDFIVKPHTNEFARFLKPPRRVVPL